MVIMPVINYELQALFLRGNRCCVSREVNKRRGQEQGRRLANA